ncbi:MAG: hypothetical protein QOG37_2344, partial [Mycobacterium sp.]|nr:hypothetical protein [Mycobacterium sp.]
MESGSVWAAVAEIRAAYDQLAELPVDSLTPPELLDVLGELEALTRRLPAQSHRMLARLQREASPVERGAKSWRDVLSGRLRISGKEATRRLDDARELGPRTTLSGEAQAPLLAKTAAAQAAGSIGAEHVAILRGFFTKLPGWVDVVTREQCETTLVRIGVGLGPDEVRKAAVHLGVLIDQDGPVPDDAERARKRLLTLGPQGADGMSKLTGWVDPLWRATWEPILAKLAAPGMCNPEDCAPRVSGTPSQEQIDADTRNLGQRTHDAFLAVGRSVLSSGELGQHHGLPATIIVSTTLQDLQAAAGSAVTAGGSLLPMGDLIRLASHAVHYLVVFDEHTSEVLHCGRAKRIAPAAHRIVLLSRDRGCTNPGCTVPGYGTQVHHTN